jgi:hypothetical protein
MKWSFYRWFVLFSFFYESKLLLGDGGVIKFIKKIVINERNSDQRHDSSIYTIDLYTDCDDDISNVLFCNSPIGYWICHK